MVAKPRTVAVRSFMLQRCLQESLVKKMIIEIITEAGTLFISRTQGYCTASVTPGEVPDSRSVNIAFAYLIFGDRSPS